MVWPQPVSEPLLCLMIAKKRLRRHLHGLRLQERARRDRGEAAARASPSARRRRPRAAQAAGGSSSKEAQSYSRMPKRHRESVQVLRELKPKFVSSRPVEYFKSRELCTEASSRARLAWLKTRTAEEQQRGKVWSVA